MTKAWRYGTAAALAIGLSLAPQAGAQDDDDAGGPLVRLLENTLSNDSRTIRVVGLEGALSGQATIEEIIVSDDDGPWLTLRGAVLDWNRLALVRGRFSVNELSADQIEIARRPTPVATVEADLPSPEAEPFALPDLPVAIEIGQISVGELALGEPVIGTAARLGVNGRLALADGTLDTLLSVARLDRAGDAMTLQAGFANDTRQIDLDVTLTEAAGGLLATAAQIPDAPALAFTARGNGPVEDFAADIGLATNGIRRFGGTVALKGQQPADDSSDADAQAIGFSAMLGGDLRPLMNVEFHPFFGTDTSLDVTGSRQPDGALAIDRFVVASQGLALTGELAIGASGVPERAMLMGRLEARDGVDRLVLPVSGAATTIRSAVIDGRLDAAQSDDWNLVMTVDGFANEAATIDTLSLRADGLIDMEGDTPSLDGELIASLRGLTLTDETVSAAVG
ncbi:MAG: translocation/assembly module TamB, partial [Pseudomonadota bacterium]